MAKKNQPAADAGKSKKNREPQTRQERRAKGKEKRTKNEGTVEEAATAPIRETAGLTFAQLEATNPSRKPAAAELPVNDFEWDFLEALADSLGKRLGVVSTETPQEAAEPEEEQLEEEEDFSTMALRRVMADEISRLLATTQPLFDGLCDSPEMAEAIAVILFEEDGGPLSARLAEVLVSDQPAEAVADLLEEVGGKVYELQLVAGAFNPNYELGRSTQLELIEPDEAARLNLKQRLSEIMTADGGMIDTNLAGLIEEGQREAEAERRRRSQFRQKLAHGLRERKQKEGRRFSNSPAESGDEEFLQFLLANRGDLAAMRDNLPIYLREQVQSLLRDEERKGPIRLQIAEASEVAQRRWAAIRSRLQAGANRPEETIARNLRAIGILRDELAQIRELGVELKKLDEPERPTVATTADYRATSRYRTQGWDRPNLAFA